MFVFLCVRCERCEYNLLCVGLWYTAGSGDDKEEAYTGAAGKYTTIYNLHKVSRMCMYILILDGFKLSMN